MGQVTAVLAMGALIYGAIEAGVLGLGAAPVWSAFILALLALAADTMPGEEDLAGLRRALRTVLVHHLGARGLKSWELMGELGRIARRTCGKPSAHTTYNLQDERSRIPRRKNPRSGTEQAAFCRVRSCFSRRKNPRFAA